MLDKIQIVKPAEIEKNTMTGGFITQKSNMKY